MSQCYKCERELPEGQVECQPFCDGLKMFSRADFTDEEIAEACREHEKNFVEIDFSKVKTLEDVLAVLPLIAEHAYVYVERGTPEYRRLKRFLKISQGNECQGNNSSDNDSPDSKL